MAAPRDADDTTLPPGGGTTARSEQHDVLFALIAHQYRFVQRELLIPALVEWKAKPEQPLSAILIERKIITHDQLQRILRLVDERLKVHDHNAEACLDALSSGEKSASDLRSFAQSDVSATLPNLGDLDDLEATTDPGQGLSETVDYHPASPANPPHPSVSKYRYRIIKPHAKGGLGEVFLAEDQELKRKVALKEIQSEYSDHVESRRRFVLEAEVTGRLEHPGIVPVYGLGKYDDGRPFYAMRFIRGDSFQKEVKTFHNQHPIKSNAFFYGRPLQSLLRRFMDVCNAIHYAHEQNILHRDIKPANVMLGKFGETLVVDWGLAKILRPGSVQPTGQRKVKESKDASPSDATRFGSIVGTPAYMSPEQATGSADLNRATDIYSLGAMLFTIVTGEVPIQGTTLQDTLNRVRTGQVRTIKSSIPSAPAALHSICCRAMALRPEDRYATARELADDLELWMADEPVMAHRDQETLIERAGRLLRRYRNWTFSLAASLVLIALVSMVASFLINRARVQEQIAKEQASTYRTEALGRYRQSREAVDTFLVEANESLALFPATLGIRARMLERAEQHYKELSSEQNQDPELEFERGRALVRLGDVFQMQRRYSDAREKYQKAMETFELDAQRKRSTDPQAADRLLAEAAYTRSRFGLTWDFEDQVDKANESYTAAIAVLRKQMQTNRFPEKSPRYLALTLANQANLAEHSGQPVMALLALRECLDLYEKYPQAGPKKTDLNREKTRSLFALALHRVGQDEKAIETIEQVQKNLMTQLESDPNQVAFREALADARSYQAEIEGTRGRVSEQRLAFEQSLKDYQQLSNEFPNEPQYLEKVAGGLMNLGVMQYESGYADESMGSFESAAQLYSGLMELYGVVSSYQEGFAATCDGLGQTLLDTNADATEAIQLFERASQIYEQLIQQSPQIIVYQERRAIVLSHWGRALMRMDEKEIAQTKFEESIRVLEQLRSEHPENPVYRFDMAHVHQWLGWLLYTVEPERAKQAFERSVALWKELAVESSSAAYGYSLALLLSECPIGAVRDSEQALEVARRAHEQSPTNRAVVVCLAKCLAESEATESLKLLDQLEPSSLEQNARYYLAKSMALRASGDSSGAETAYAAAQEWFKKHQPGNEVMAGAFDDAE